MGRQNPAMPQTTAVTGCVFSHHLPSVGPLLHGLLLGDDWHRVKVVSWLAARYGLTSNVAYFARTKPGFSTRLPRRSVRPSRPARWSEACSMSLLRLALSRWRAGLPGVNCLAMEGTTLALKKERQ